MNDGARKLLKWVGYPLFAFLSFWIFIYLTFPYEQLRGRIEDFLSAGSEMQVTIGKLGPSPLLGVSAQQVMITFAEKDPVASRSATASAVAERKKPLRLALDEVTVNTGLFSLLGGGVDVAFNVDGMGGHVKGRYSNSGEAGWSVDVEAEQLDLEQVPVLADKVGLPLGGQLTAEVELNVPQNRWSEAEGLIQLACDDCRIGDGKAKLKIPGNAFLQSGITFPKLQLGRLGGQVKVEKGAAALENIQARSTDIELGVEGQLDLRNPLSYSQAQVYLKFKISQELKKRKPEFELLESQLTNAKRDDGFYGMLISGVFKNLRFVPSKLGPGRGGPARRRLGPSRPGFQGSRPTETREPSKQARQQHGQPAPMAAEGAVAAALARRGEPGPHQ